MKTDKIIKAAAEIAEQIHSGQRDKGDEDYFSGHLTSVAACGKNWKEKVLGFLHDAAEYTQVTELEVITELNQKCDNQISEEDKNELMIALVLLNNKHSASREEYLNKMKGNDLVLRVKLCDLKNNMNLTRINYPTQKDFDRIERYKKEIAMLESWLKSDLTPCKN